jgi:hypothetical protein
VSAADTSPYVHSAAEGFQNFLRLPQAGLGLLPLGQIAHEAGVVAPPTRVHFADRKLLEGRAPLTFADDDAADADEALFAIPRVSFQVSVVVLRYGDGIGILTFLPVGRLIAEQAFRRQAERADRAALVDGQRSRGAPTGWLNRAGVSATIDASSGFIGGPLPAQQTSKGDHHDRETIRLNDNRGCCHNFGVNRSDIGPGSRRFRDGAKNAMG